MNSDKLRGILTDLSILPPRFVESTDIRVGNFRFQRWKTQVLKPAAPGYRKWIDVDRLEWVEVKYHLNKLLKENNLNIQEESNRSG
ncbi:hypothetical protein CDGHABPJ_00154 [Pseudomonas phage OMKO1]|nr:hypothetical protein CDGHABPJ_00154 [Pseudomonas phage OMKO1]WNV47697.1 hypothetical protein [Pseudomonas phage fMGyn-Pae01]